MALVAQRLGGVCALLVLVTACGAQPDDGTVRVSIMTFNVENLFDTTDDPSRRDEAFLPFADKQTDAHRALCADITVERWRDECLYADWNDVVLQTKLDRIAAAILQEQSGRGPDIVVLQEVENRAVLERLRREFLAPADYGPAVLLEGQDTRGIDVAVLSRLPLDGDAILHAGVFTDYPRGERNDTRGILQVPLRLANGVGVTVFAAHFPAPFHPAAMRETAYRHLNELAAAVAPDRLIVAGGDFNTTRAEIAARDTLDRFVRPTWQRAQDHGCARCPGTYYYARDDVWNELDSVFWRTSAALDVAVVDVRLANQAPQQSTTDGKPRAFRLPAATGVSDHWPLVVELAVTR
ncbi:MAG: endonuclease/exonuclease/phosphatase family protein [Pseudomonadota bacterium]